MGRSIYTRRVSKGGRIGVVAVVFRGGRYDILCVVNGVATSSKDDLLPDEGCGMFDRLAAMQMGDLRGG